MYNKRNQLDCNGNLIEVGDIVQGTGSGDIRKIVDITEDGFPCARNGGIRLRARYWVIIAKRGVNDIRKFEEESK